MDVPAALTFAAASGCYVLAALSFFWDLARTEGSLRATRWGPRFLAGGAVVHLLHIVRGSVVTMTCPLLSSKPTLGLAALVTVAAFLRARRAGKVQVLGAVVAPLALAVLVGTEFVTTTRPEPPHPALLAVHVLANLVGLGLFLLAAGLGMFYLVHERRLKTRRFGPLTAKLPPLDALDRMEHRLLLAGLPALSMGIVTGAAVLAQVDELTVVGLARAGLTIAAWIVLSGVLVLRAVAGWRGRRAAYGTIGGTACILLVVLVYLVVPWGAG